MPAWPAHLGTHLKQATRPPRELRDGVCVHVQAGSAAATDLADARAELTAVVGDLAEAERRAETRAAEAARAAARANAAEAAFAERDAEVR